MRSVDDQLRPSKNGGMPSFATICSNSWRTGISLESIRLSLPIACTCTSPTAIKSRTVFSSRIALLQASAICCARSAA